MSDFKIVKLIDPINISLTGPSFTGAYNNGTTYSIGQSVSYNGSSYVALQVTTGNLPTDASFWQILAEKGAPGGDESTVVCRNITGVTIPKRSVVYISGVSGTRPTIELAQADNQLTADSTLGITVDAISNNSNGPVIVFGLLESIDTTAFSEGDKLYLSPTVAGGITNVKPVSPHHEVGLGIVTFSNANGSIEVRIEPGVHLEDLHDVSLASLSNNQILKYNSTSELWQNHTLTKADVGLSNVLNIDTTDPVNINQSVSYRFTTDTEKTSWNAKVSQQFETVSKNLKSWNAVFNYTTGTLTSIVYTDGVDTITKTFNYTSGALTSMVLSGDTPAGIDLTKTLGYTTGVLTSITYS